MEARSGTLKKMKEEARREKREIKRERQEERRKLKNLKANPGDAGIPEGTR